MSVRKRWFTKEGKRVEQYAVDFRFTHPNGTTERIQLRSPVDTRRGAEQFERETREALQAGTFRKEIQAETVLTFEQFQKPFLEHAKNNNKPSALDAKQGILRNHLAPFFGSMPLNAIGAEEIERFKAMKAEPSFDEKGDEYEGHCAKSINNHLAVLRKLLNLAAEYGAIEKAPKVKGLKLGEQEFDFLSFEETPRFLAAAKPEWRPMFYVALKTGLRIGELLALKWEDMDLKTGRLIVKRSMWQGQEGTPKGGRRREVPLSATTVAMLKAERHLRGSYVFCKDDGKPHTHNQLQNLVPQTCRAAGLPKRLTWHDLRHTFASHLVMRGRSIVEVQQLLGHTTLAMTLRYAHLSPDVKRDAVNVLDDVTTAASGDSAVIGT